MANNEHDEVEWLDEEEQIAWRHFLRGTAFAIERINRDMVEDNGITFNEYEVLVRLSESPDRKARMSQLAKNLVHSRSRLTHTVSRLEAAGYVLREPCADDRRGIMCTLTDAGFAKLEQSAPKHVNSVREHLLSKLTRDEFLAYGDTSAKLLGEADFSQL
ncbi:DNA-binding MarR family transcriptional regulator [Arcanobacterium wilhelmae]|uniref:DNA-binding MarR family transcriptional regulator n=1 Tax=Arcanobacterium wilhelmae TaxID=1803177 RepID=A0ABT9NA47_9ACTO|nr:MarR family transcriptional regulator [Arcanobacterium wilhelmae]MDP9800574.1 DNA-binding MarR family transcriptional regulator [Arcanobacterium wilhelmae]WFN89988.1 MarR family transcriptional regulator [Arcanobacterium wilhelmae]